MINFSQQLIPTSAQRASSWIELLPRMPFHAQCNGANKLVMWTRRKFSGFPLNTTVTTGSSYGSWEEQVFAEDSAGRLGGCIWPPRSYSCSFCRREFRSAQALGGHMNVHRRDRARLKQSPNATSENYDNHDHHHLDLCKPLGAQHIPQLRPAVYNPNPNSNKTLGVAASALSLSRVSAVVSQEICDDHIRGEIQDCGKESLLSTPTPLIDSIDVGEKTVPELKLGRENLRARDMGCQRQRDGDQDDENVPSTKRRRANSILPLFGRSASANQDLHQSEVLKPGPSPVEDLDLELRLGHRPKVQ